MKTTPARVLTLHIAATEPISGSVRDETGANRDFRGWLGLALALETALRASGSADRDRRDLRLER